MSVFESFRNSAKAQIVNIAGRANKSWRFNRYIKKGRALENVKNYNEAIALYRRGLEGARNLDELHFRIGFCHERLGHRSEAAQAYSKAISLNPAMGKAHFRLGLIEEREGNLDACLSAYQAAVGCTPHDPEWERRLRIAQRKKRANGSKTGAPKKLPKCVADACHHGGVEKVSNCGICRSLDSYEQKVKIIEIISAEADFRGASLWKLPSFDETRIGIDRSPGSSFIAHLVRVLRDNGYNVQERTVGLENNLYEFNQVRHVSPERATFYRIYPKPHCEEGEQYLPSQAVFLEPIEDEGDDLVIPRPGRGPRVCLKEHYEGRKLAKQGAVSLSEWPFEIDVVYTWVDKDDAFWKEQFLSVQDDIEHEKLPASSANMGRWYSRNELLYSIQSVRMYAPFVRNIYVVTNGQKPSWINNYNDVKIVSHEEIFPDKSCLPTFNSHAIETCLHNISGLSEHFLYLNDDFFFAKPASPSSYFSLGGVCYAFFSSRFLELLPPGDADRATVAAHKRSRQLLLERFGIEWSQKLKHAPYAMRRSVWEQIEKDFSAEIEATRRSRFRSHDDIPGPHFYQQYSLIKGFSVPGKITTAYVDVSDENFCGKMPALNSPKVQVFCINDADSDGDVRLDVEESVATWLASRFPIDPLVEQEARRGQPSQPFINGGGLYEEVKANGVEAAEFHYLANLSRDVGAARKLFRLYYNQARWNEALEVIPYCHWKTNSVRLREIDVLSRSGASIGKLCAHYEALEEGDFARALGYMVRSVNSLDDLKRLEGLVRGSDAKWLGDREILKKLANAARRAGELEKAIRYLERALAVATPQPGRADVRRDAQVMQNPQLVLEDVLTAAGPDRDALFLDAGTLLGCIREGSFIGHDYDIDLSVRDASAFARIRKCLGSDWRFNLALVRTPDLLIQAKHVNGTNVDIFLHKKAGEVWEKKSHVFGWRFEDYSLAPSKFLGIDVNIPQPVERYLEQMYGSDWRTPMKSFDSRLEAPNCFFPDKDELACTVLAKIIDAVVQSDWDAVKRLSVFVEQNLARRWPDGLGHVIPVGDAAAV